MKQISSVLSMSLLAVFLAVPFANAAGTAAKTSTRVDVDTHIDQAKQASYQLREAADKLRSITLNGRLSSYTHSWHLNLVRENVNQLGKMLPNLESLKPHATEAQQMAIETMRPRLVETVNALSNAIELFNERRNNIYFDDYRNAVKTVSNQADSLHQSLDAVWDYEAAKGRLERLELSPSAEAGS